MPQVGSYSTSPEKASEEMAQWGQGLRYSRLQALETVKGIRLTIPYKAKAWRAGREIRRLPEKNPDNPALYKGHYQVERAFAWYDKFRHIALRYEHKALLYKAFWQLASAWILWEKLTG